MTVTTAALQAIWKAKGYAWFGAPWDLNVFGIRDHAKADTWNDLVGVATVTEAGTELLYLYEATTDPGLVHLHDPGRPEGTAILAEGQHRGLWRSGLHKGQRPALVQVAPCRVYRDGNRDDVIDLRPGDAGILGTYGINLHDGGNAKGGVGAWSAGCQVLKCPDDVAHVLSLVKRQAAAGHGETVSYTLIRAEELL